MDFAVSASDREWLLRAARDAVEARVLGKGAETGAPPPGCAIRCGAFVTIHAKGRLRGCIGRMRADAPIAETVTAMAQAAAFEDPRFRPVAARELPDLRFEITLLSEMTPLDSPSGIRIGVDGLHVSSGWNAGVLLPQVAVEYGWDAPEFLARTCEKAGLPGDAWMRPDTKVMKFEGVVFGEA